MFPLGPLIIILLFLIIGIYGGLLVGYIPSIIVFPVVFIGTIICIAIWIAIVGSMCGSDNKVINKIGTGLAYATVIGFISFVLGAIIWLISH